MTTQWTKEMEATFQSLAEIEALGYMTPEQFEEMDRLFEAREASFPRTEEEIRRREEYNTELEKRFSNLGNHIRFIEPTLHRPQWPLPDVSEAST